MKDYIVFAITMAITGILFNIIYILWKKRKIKKKYEYITSKESDTVANIYLEDLLKEIKKRGILVKVMKKEDSFLTESFTCYKKNLGAVPIKDIRGNISSVYVAYEDFDGSIKYYDYPQNQSK
jgi:hypothetical protein